MNHNNELTIINKQIDDYNKARKNEHDEIINILNKISNVDLQYPAVYINKCSYYNKINDELI